METVASSLLVVHVLAGALSLATALLAMSLKKGSRNHRKVGTVYFWAMLVVGATAIPVTFIRPNPFLFAIAIFSFYFAFAGYRRGKTKYQPNSVDKIAAWLMVLTSIGMILYGIYMALVIAPVGWALFAFGCIGLQNSIEDVRDFTRALSFYEKTARHLQRMIAGTIATVTAVLVQQVAPLLDPRTIWPTVLWLSPTVILVPLIFVWSTVILSDRRLTLLKRQKIEKDSAA